MRTSPQQKHFNRIVRTTGGRVLTRAGLQPCNWNVVESPRGLKGPPSETPSDRGEEGPIPCPALSQRECVQRSSTLNAYVLLSVDHVSHRAGRNGWSQVGLPQQLAIASIDCDELSVASPREQHVGRCGQHSALRGWSRQPEGPLAIS